MDPKREVAGAAGDPNRPPAGAGAGAPKREAPGAGADRF